MDVEYFRDAAGREPVREFIDDLYQHRKGAAAKIVAYIDRILSRHQPGGPPLPANLVKALGHGLFELRPEHGNVEYRIYFTIDNRGTAWLLHATQKKPNRRTEQAELDRAYRCLEQHRGGRQQ
ncbi:MAG TPA: type II toxin-antitoxin system RelE/ParE family toxin [Dehalococcoidia bacterium]|nr:type II toxin-antitoxin system RelE/ParE family toxin [Dehalococcoidia bacterium]